MKRIIFLIVIMLISGCSFATENDKTTSQWGESTSVFNTGFENQEAVSDSKLKKAIQAIKENNLSRKQKKIRAEVKPLSPSSDIDHLKEFTETQSPDDELSQTLTVMIPMPAYSDDGIWIQPGYYKLSCRKIGNNDYVLDLSQGPKKVMSVPAKQTKQDLEQDTIAFCNAEIIDNGRIRLMYGSIDLNLVGYIYY